MIVGMLSTSSAARVGVGSVPRRPGTGGLIGAGGVVCEIEEEVSARETGATSRALPLAFDVRGRAAAMEVFLDKVSVSLAGSTLRFAGAAWRTAPVALESLEARAIGGAV